MLSFLVYLTCMDYFFFDLTLLINQPIKAPIQKKINIEIIKAMIVKKGPKKVNAKIKPNFPLLTG